MGEETVKLIRNKKDRQQHLRAVLRDLRALEQMLKNGIIESGITRIGAEQELCFVDSNWRPAPIIMEVLNEITDPAFCTEYARFNMEINLDPVELKEKCFSEMEKLLRTKLKLAEKVANKFDARVLLTGILPTIGSGDITKEIITPLPRYHKLTDILHEQRGGDFEFRIEGTDSLILKDVLSVFEGSNTSFQVHYQVDPQDFVSKYNWSMAITAPLMAASTNSPLLLGKRLWRETRIALFQQSIDTRTVSQLMREDIPRVNFGTAWLQSSVLEVFKEDIARQSILLGSRLKEDSLDCLAEGKIPNLNNLMIHNGTIYKWNRPCYGVANGVPHLRIEQRVLPAGPSVIDEIANAAFWIGMMHGMPKKYANFSKLLEFDVAKFNFTKAARQGLGAHFFWPGYKKQISSTELILNELLPIARSGLEKANVDPKDIDRYLNVIERRVESGRTGSEWQVTSFQKLKKHYGTGEALVATTAGMYHRQQKNTPSHKWTIAKMEEAGSAFSRYWTIGQVMSRDLYTVDADDSIEFAANIMEWRNIRHLPVEDPNGKLIGLITSQMLMKYLCKNKHPKKRQVYTRDIMIKKIITIGPNTPTIEAIHLMQKNEVGCLPVILNDKLIGLVTEYDIVNIAANLLFETTPKESN